jgi:DNA-binding winged helix-turn-helix (wHTH) protein
VRIRFGAFTLDSDTRQLLHDGRDVRLSPKAFDLLCLLADRRPRVVSKADLHARIWPDTFVVDANLNVLIGEIRQALDDTPRDSRFIRTVHKVGYAFCAEAIDASAPTAAASTGLSSRSSGSGRCWLVWNDQTLVLAAGENIIGRDPACNVWLDAPGVSRRHARIQIEGSQAWLEDLGSTNGTFLAAAPVAERVALKHADVIQVGSVDLTFRTWSADTLKKTARIRRRG